MSNLAAVLAASMLSQGVPATVADTVRLDTTESGQGVLTIGYDRKGRRSVTAQTLTPTLNDAVAILADRDRLAGFLAQGLRAIPAASRPQVPAWITQSAEAARADAMRARATGLACGAAIVTAGNDADLPWAA